MGSVHCRSPRCRGPGVEVRREYGGTDLDALAEILLRLLWRTPRLRGDVVSNKDAQEMAASPGSARDIGEVEDTGRCLKPDEARQHRSPVSLRATVRDLPGPCGAATFAGSARLARQEGRPRSRRAARLEG